MIWNKGAHGSRDAVSRAIQDWSEKGPAGAQVDAAHAAVTGILESGSDSLFYDVHASGEVTDAGTGHFHVRVVVKEESDKPKEWGGLSRDKRATGPASPPGPLVIPGASELV